ncbi:MAG: lamin tail domain-containing protein [Myxococcales bacterium]|nr:lamin tail domain-containing protein [Myxococcales bacterium]
MRHAALFFTVLALAACGDSGSTPDSNTKRDTGIDGARDATLDGPGSPDGAADAAGDATVDRGPLPDQARRDLLVFSDSVTKPDGCAPPAGDVCSSPSTLTLTGSSVTVNGSTTCAADHLDFPFNGCGGVLVDGSSGNDVFYDISLSPGTYEIKLSASWDPALYVISSCSTSASACIAASDDITPGNLERVTLKVTSTQSYRIGVDSWDPTEFGSYTLTITKTGTTVDGGPSGDSTVDAGPSPDGPGTSGPLVITEIMANPSAVTDGVGEWFEVHNPTASPVNMRNYTIQDQPGSAQNKFTITSDVIVAPGGYAVLGFNGNKATNGNVDIAYVYPSSFQLANGSDEIIMLDGSNVEVDRVYYSGTFVVSGSSTALKSPGLDNNVLSNWCAETTPWTGSAGDNGSPGKATVCQ